jgi:hypothetical protein
VTKSELTLTQIDRLVFLSFDRCQQSDERCGLGLHPAQWTDADGRGRCLPVLLTDTCQAGRLCTRSVCTSSLPVRCSWRSCSQHLHSLHSNPQTPQCHSNPQPPQCHNQNGETPPLDVVRPVLQDLPGAPAAVAACLGHSALLVGSQYQICC